MKRKPPQCFSPPHHFNTSRASAQSLLLLCSSMPTSERKLKGGGGWGAFVGWEWRKGQQQCLWLQRNYSSCLPHFHPHYQQSDKCPPMSPKITNKLGSDYSKRAQSIGQPHWLKNKERKQQKRQCSSIIDQ